MTKEDKELLLKDLCARLPYGVIVQDRNGTHVLTTGNTELGTEHIKPYLRPMSSMTEDEIKELSKILDYEFYIDDDFALAAEDDRHRIRLDLLEGYIDWLISHHFDYRGLIPMGLALEATEDMYKTE